MGIRAKIAEAFVSFTADLTGLKSGMKDAEKTTATTAGRISNALGTVGRIAFPAGFTVAILAAGRAALNAADQLNELRLKTGASTEFLSIMKYQAELSGSSMEDVAGSFKFLANAQDEARKGSATAIASFKSIGVSLHDLQTLNPEALWKKVVEGLGSLSDPATRAARAQDILGRSAQTLLPLINDLADGGFAKAAREAEELGVVIDTKTALAADDFNDSLSRLKAGFIGFGNQMLQIVLPALQVFATEGQRVMGEVRTALRDLLDETGDKDRRLGNEPSWLAMWAQSAMTEARIVFRTTKSAIWTYGEAAIKGSYDPLRDLWRRQGQIVEEELARGGEGLDLSSKREAEFAAQAAALQAALDAIGKTGSESLGKLNDAQIKASASAAETVLGLQLERAELLGDAQEADRLRGVIDELAASKMRAAGVSEELIQKTLSLKNANRETGEELKKLDAIEAATLARAKEAYQLRQEAQAATQKALELDLQLRQSRAELTNDTVALAQVERDRAEFEAHQRADEIAALAVSLETKRSLITLSEQKLMSELAVIDARYATGWKAALDGVIASQAAGQTTMTEMAKQTSAELTYALGDAFYSSITGDLGKVDDAFRDFFKSLLRRIVNLMAERAVLSFLNMLGTTGGGASAGGSGGGAFWSGNGVSAGLAAGGGLFKGGLSPIPLPPEFKGGAMVQDPTLALVGEGRFDEAVIPMPNGAVPVEMISPRQDTNVNLNQRIVLDAGVIAAMKSSPDEMITVVSADILRGGQVLNAIRSRVKR